MLPHWSLYVLLMALVWSLPIALAQDPNEVPPGGQPPGQESPSDPNTPGQPAGAQSKSKPNTPPAEPKTIKRPTEPKPAPVPRPFSIKPDDQGMIEFQFRDQAWPDVLQWVADVSGLALDWQELPADLLSIATPEKMSLIQTRDVLNRHLLARGFTILEFPGVLQVVKTK